MELAKQTYVYDGPVMLFGRCIMDNWQAETFAVSAAKAKSNFKYQFKKFYGKVVTSQIDLPGEVRLA